MSTTERGSSDSWISTELEITALRWHCPTWISLGSNELYFAGHDLTLGGGSWMMLTGRLDWRPRTPSRRSWPGSVRISISHRCWPVLITSRWLATSPSMAIWRCGRASCAIWRWRRTSRRGSRLSAAASSRSPWSWLRRRISRPCTARVWRPCARAGWLVWPVRPSCRAGCSRSRTWPI
jgi:hypothetical protein